MTRINAKVTYPRAAVLLLCLQSGCFSCGGGGDPCAGFECNEAICEGDTVAWCPCEETGDPDSYGPEFYMVRADCAARNERCVVASDGSNGTLREAICMDSCDDPEEYACREGPEGPSLFACNAHRPEADDDEHGGPHESTYGEPHPDSTYQGLFAWVDTGRACTSCQSTCGCALGDRCAAGFCVRTLMRRG